MYLIEQMNDREGGDMISQRPGRYPMHPIFLSAKPNKQRTGTVQAALPEDAGPSFGAFGLLALVCLVG